MESCNSHPINFDQRLSYCPACTSENIQHSVFKSIVAEVLKGSLTDKRGAKVV
jgi:hypothetical protein